MNPLSYELKLSARAGLRPLSIAALPWLEWRRCPFARVPCPVGEEPCGEEVDPRFSARAGDRCVDLCN